MNQPLSSWVCDACMEHITDPAGGLLTWREDDLGRAHDFMLVHKNTDGRRCDPGFRAGYSSNVEITSVLGPIGQASLLSFLSPGPLKGGGRVRVLDFDQFVDAFRRLQTPWSRRPGRTSMLSLSKWR